MKSTIPLLHMFAVILALIIIIVSQLWHAGRIADDVGSLVHNGGRVIAIRFPDSPTEQREFVIIVEPRGSYAPHVARVVNDGQRERGSVTDLPARQWTDLEHLRTSWCQELPTFAPSAQPSFDVGIACNLPIQRIHSYTFQLPLDKVPPEIKALLRSASSPTCRDPFCGWPIP